jgi:Flp pilus assembly protein TadG
MSETMRISIPAIILSCRAAVSRLARDTDGGPAVGFAFALPLLMMIVIGLIDFGSHMVNTTALRNAARAAVQYARVKPSDSAGIQAVAVQIGKLDPATLNVTTTLFCECTPGVKVQCSQQCPGAAMQKFVQVEVTQAFDPIIPYPELLLPPTVTGRATIRYQ